MKRAKKAYPKSLSEPIPFDVNHMSKHEREEYFRAKFLAVQLEEIEKFDEASLTSLIEYLSGVDKSALYEHFDKGCEDLLRKLREKRLSELLDHLKIPHTDDESHWRELVMRLAIANIPGFRTCRSKGRPKKTRGLTDSALADMVSRKLQGMKSKNVSLAVKNLHHDFPQIEVGDVMPARIRRAYYRGQKLVEKRIHIKGEKLARLMLECLHWFLS